MPAGWTLSPQVAGSGWREHLPQADLLQFLVHRLIRAPRLGAVCDMCEEKSEQMYFCPQCDFDVCPKCFQRKDKSQAEGMLRGDRGIKDEHMQRTVGQYLGQAWSLVVAPNLLLLLCALGFLSLNSAMGLLLPGLQELSCPLLFAVAARTLQVQLYRHHFLGPLQSFIVLSLYSHCTLTALFTAQFTALSLHSSHHSSLHSHCTVRCTLHCTLHCTLTALSLHSHYRRTAQFTALGHLMGTLPAGRGV